MRGRDTTMTYAIPNNYAERTLETRLAAHEARLMPGERTFYVHYGSIDEKMSYLGFKWERQGEPEAGPEIRALRLLKKVEEFRCNPGERQHSSHLPLVDLDYWITNAFFQQHLAAYGAELAGGPVTITDPVETLADRPHEFNDEGRLPIANFGGLAIAASLDLGVTGLMQIDYFFTRAA